MFEVEVLKLYGVRPIHLCICYIDGRDKDDKNDIDCRQHVVAVTRKMLYEVCDSVEFILIVEKDTVFDDLCLNELWTLLPCVLICAKGNPDYATRFVVAQLAKKTKATVVCLCDWNPHGLGIFLCYCIGSYNTAYESENLATNIKWMGLGSRHVKDFLVC
jgi:DNA topoisomerase VI subunit A